MPAGDQLGGDRAHAAPVLRVGQDLSRHPLISIDKAKNIARFRVPKDLKKISWWRSDRRYYVENSLSFLDTPGEWYLDAKRRVIYVHPAEGHDLAKATVLAPVLDRLMEFKGRPESKIVNLHFEGLAFAHSGCVLPERGYHGSQADVKAGAAIEADFLSHSSFRRCSFRHLGRYALWIRRGCTGNAVADCEFSDLGAGAVEVGEDTRSSTTIKHETTGNEVSGNHLHDGGHIFHGTVGIWVGPASTTRIARNHIHHFPYSGISVGWNWSDSPSGAHHNVIESNRIHDVMTIMPDGAGIYTLGRQPGTVIRDNVIHDVTGWNAQGRGIYLDQGSSEMIIENNLCARTLGASLVLHQSNRNILRNNIFALSATRAINPPRSKDNVLERNIIYCKESYAFRLGAEAEAVRMNHNLYYEAHGNPLTFPGGVTFEEWRNAGQDTASKIADPKFADVERGDFSLSADSPALKLGFKPFELPVIGPERTNRFKSPRMLRLFKLTSKIMRGCRSSPAAPANLAAKEKGLVAWWPFEEVTEKSARVMDARIFMGVKKTKGQLGKALALDGDTAHLKVPYIPALNITDAVTLSAWVKLRNEQPYWKGVAGIVGRPQIYRLCVTENKPPYSIQLGIFPEGGSYSGLASERTIKPGRWTHVAGTYESRTGELAVYINGELSRKRQIKPGTKIRGKPGHLFIGVRDWDRSYLAGAVDEVKIHSRALTPGEIRAEYLKARDAGQAGQ